MAFAFVVDSEVAGSGNTPSVDTTGATLIVLAVAQDTASTAPTDSKGNTWTALTQYTQGNSRIQLWRCINPAVGSGHTFAVGTSSGYPAIGMIAVSGTSPTYDAVNGAGGSGVSTIATGTVTPSANGAFLVTAYTAYNAGNVVGASSPFDTETAAINVGGSNVALGMSYAIQGTAAAQGCTWTHSSTDTLAATIAAFVEAGGGGATRGTPFGNRGTAFNGGRCLQGIIR